MLICKFTLQTVFCFNKSSIISSYSSDLAVVFDFLCLKQDAQVRSPSAIADGSLDCVCIIFLRLIWRLGAFDRGRKSEGRETLPWIYHETHSCTKTQFKVPFSSLSESALSADGHLCGCSLDKCWSPAGWGHSPAKPRLCPVIHSRDLELPGLSAFNTSVRSGHYHIKSVVFYTERSSNTHMIITYSCVLPSV